MRNNWTIIAAIVLAIVTATLAIIFRPVRQTDEWETLTATITETETTETTTETTETEPVSKETTTEVKLPRETEKRTEAATVASTTKYSSKVVSKLHEIAEKEKEWLSQRETKPTTTESYSMSPSEFRRAGVIYYNGYKFTYYSEKVLPGKGLKIPGRHSDGNFVRDGDGYIVLASCDLPKGTVVQTPFGAGKVYDYCPTSGTIDVYVSW